MGAFDDIIAASKQAKDTLAAVPGNFRQTMDAVNAAPAPFAPRAAGPLNPETVLRGAAARGLGYWRGYVQPKIDQAVKPLAEFFSQVSR